MFIVRYSCCGSGAQQQDISWMKDTEVVQLKKSRSTLDKHRGAFILGAVGLIVAVVFIACILSWRQEKKNEEKINIGLAYLSGLEKKDVTAISEQIDAIKAARSLQLAEIDENAVWSGFDSTMILGDSRAVGFRFYEFLPENQVIAESGRKITDVTSEIEKIKTISPKQVFLCFGLNDIKSELWPEPAEYAGAYREVVDLLSQELPGTTVYINSILPAIGSGYESYAGYARIGDYNAALQQMAQDNGCRFIDNTSIAQEHMDLYEADGLHLQKDFYKYWAANMLAEVKNQ